MTYLNSNWTGRTARTLEETCGVRSTQAQIYEMPGIKADNGIRLRTLSVPSTTKRAATGRYWLGFMFAVGLAMSAYMDFTGPDEVQAARMTAAQAAQVAQVSA
jgi:hypothetical protein